MLNYEEFCAYVEENVLEKISGDEDKKVSIQDVCKNNGVKLKGLTILRKGKNISPTVYMEHYFEQYEMEQATLEDILQEIAEVFSDKNADRGISFDLSCLKPDRVIGCLVGRNGNEDFLRDIPFIPCGQDLAVIFKVLLEKRNGIFPTITMTDAFAQIMNLSVEELYQLALVNTPKLLPAEVENLGDVMRGILSEMPDMDSSEDFLEATEISTYVVSNTSHLYGAFALFYPQMLDMLFKTFKSDIIFIPCSIHEWLFMPFDDKADLGKLNEIVQSVNASSVDAQDILGEQVYLLRQGQTDIFKQFISNYAYCR